MATISSFTPAADPACYNPRMTRAQAIARRTAGTLRENCVVVITDGPAIGADPTPTEIELNPVSPTELGHTARVHTVYDNTAWSGVYDIDLGTGTIQELHDNVGNHVKDVDSSSPTIVAFPWGNVNFRDNYAEDSVLTGWDVQVGLVTNNTVKNSTIDLSAKTSGTIDSTEFTNTTITSGQEFSATNSIVDGGTYTLGAAGSVTFTRARLEGVSITRNAAATNPVSIIQSQLLGGVIIQNAGATGTASLFITSSQVSTPVITQNGPGPLSMQFVTGSSISMSNTVAATRGLSISRSGIFRGIFSQARTNGTATDVYSDSDMTQGTLNLLGAAGIAGSLSLNGNSIRNSSVVNITDPVSSSVLQNATIESQSTLNLQAGGDFIRGRLSSEATLNTGAFSHLASIIDGQFTKTSTGANVNRLVNKSYDDWI